MRRLHPVITGGLVAFLACGVAAGANFATGEADARYPIRRHLRYNLTVENPTGRLIPMAHLWVYAPVKITSTQECLHVHTSHPAELIVDALGNQVLRFRLENLPPHGVRVVTVQADLALSPEPQQFPQADLRPFLGPGPLVESDNPAIVNLAQQFAAAGSARLAEQTYRWVAEKIRYAGYLKDDRGALYAFQHREGDCTEYMALFVALARAGGLPARGMAGYVYDHDALVRPEDFHNWAEFRRDGKWLLADPQNRVFADRGEKYIAFRVLGPADNGVLGAAHRFRAEPNYLDVSFH